MQKGESEKYGYAPEIFKRGRDMEILRNYGGKKRRGKRLEENAIAFLTVT